MTDPQKYWFPAKRYGWGWGLPRSWQGWVSLGAYTLLFAGGILLLPPNRNAGFFGAYIALITMLLMAVCWLKGEPPRWRWGDE